MPACVHLQSIKECECMLVDGCLELSPWLSSFHRLYHYIPQ